jgi:hypothetical protein
MVAGLQGLIEDVPIEQTPIYDPEELMSIDSKIPFLQSIKKGTVASRGCQVVQSKNNG